MASTSFQRTSSRRFPAIVRVLLLLVMASSMARSQSGNEIVYVYDELGRLAAVINPLGETATYNYDAVGNVLSISRYNSSVVSIIEFTPNSGSTGTTVTIYGTGFSTTASQNTVSFNGVSASVTSASFSQIVTTVPSGATTGPITVTTPTGTAVSAAAFNVGGSPAPTITGFSPTIGTVGTPVTITGTNFETATSHNRVKFNNTLASVSSAIATSLDTSVPLTTASGRITVGTAAGTATSSADFFIPPSPYTAADVEVVGRMTIGESKSVALTTANKIALIVFDGVEGQRISLKVNTSTIASGVVTIHKPNGSSLSSTNINTSGGFLDNSLLTATGTHTIMIDPGGTSTGNLNFTLYNVPDITGPITIDVSTVTVGIAAPGQNARITFSGTAGQRVSIGMSGVTIGTSTCCSTYLSVTNPDGSTLLAAIDVGTSGGGTSTITLPVTGTYVIFVDPKSTSTGNMTLTLSTELASTISVGGSSVPLSLPRVGQNAAIGFDGTAGQRVSLGMSSVTIGTSTCCSTYVWFNKPDGTTLLSTFEIGTSGAGSVTVTLPVTGTYKIYIDPKGASTGNITLTLSEEVTGNITIGGDSLPLSLSRPGQNAAISFDGTAGQRVSLGMSSVTIGTSTCCSTYVWFNKPDGTTLLSTFEIGTSGAGSVTVTLPVTGTYKIYIDPKGASAGNITLTLSEELTGNITIGGDSLPLSLSRPGQNAAISFDGTAGQRVSLGMSSVTIGTSSCCSTYVWFNKPDGTTLLSTFEIGTSGAGSVTVTLPVTGTYKIYIDPKGASAGNITLTLSEELTGNITIGGDSLPLSLSRPGQNAAISFDGTAGQRVSLGMSSVTIGTSSCCSTYVWFNKPDGTTLLSTFEIGTSGAGSVTVTLPVTGTYKIYIDPKGASAGNITLTLSEDLTGSITIGGSALPMSLSRPGQNAAITFAGTTGQQVTVRVTSNTISNLTVKLLKPDGTQLTSANSSSASFNLTTQTLPTTGTYTITIDPGGINVGSLNLNVTNP